MGKQVAARSFKKKTGFTSDQRIERKFSFLMTDKASVESFAQAERACTLKTAYTK